VEANKIGETMSLSTNLVAGLASGFDWRSMIDQLMEIEHRGVDLVEDQKTDYESKLEIFQSINTKLLSFKTQSTSLASSKAFNVFSSSLTTDSTTYKASDMISASTSTSAAPGTHTITMNSNSAVAQARQISSKSFTTYDTALSLSGELVINGRAMEVETTDDLWDIRDKINNLNSGTNATGITASVMTVSSSNYRLILTSDDTGEDAFTIFDASTSNILSTGLGFTDGTTSVNNYVSNGFQSEAFSSSTQAVGSMLGLSNTLTGTGIVIGDVTDIDIDLSTDSLTDIADEINDESTGNVSASVVSTTEDGVTTYRLKIVNTTGSTDNNNVLQALGLIKGDQGNVAEVHQGSSVLYNDTDVLLDSDNGGADDLTTINMTDLRIAASDSAGVAIGDTIRVSGTKTDGTTVTATGTVNTDFTTVAQFMTWLDGEFTGGGSPANAVTVRFDDGLIKITDDNAGDSQLSITISANNEGDGKLDFGAVSATTEGYTMETQAGQDAKITIDGTAVTSSSNVIDDVIAGVTLNLKTVEADKTITLTVARDYDTIKSSVQSLLDQYNEVMTDINAQFAYDEDTETAGLLQGDATLRSVKTELVDIVVSTITGLPSTINALSLIGITSDDDGNLSIDDDDFKDAFNNNFNGLERVFVAEGSTTDGDVQYINHANETVAGEYAINITTAATQAQATGTSDLSGGIASNLSTIAITQSSKTAAIILDGSDDGSSIDNIVNAINSELDNEYAQSVMGNVKNTASDLSTAITSSTVWSAVFSDGSSAGLADDDEITFSGAKKNGSTVSGSYTISDVASDTVQGLLSAIEAAYDYEVSAGINTYGYLVVTDNTTGNSSLDISITEPATKNLNFGEVTTSNLVGSVRNTTGGGAAAITAATKWNAIDDPLQNGDVIEFSGYTVSGNAVEGSYTASDVSTDTVDGLLTAIETAYNAGGGSVTAEIQDGRIVIKDGTTNSTLGIEILEPSARNLDFGTVSGGVTGRYAVDITASKDGSNKLVLTHDEYGSDQSFTIQLSDTDLGTGAGASDLQDNTAYSGVDVAGTINEEDATGSGQVLTGDAPGSGETTSVEGLAIKYTGSGTGSQGTVKITMGVAELFDRLLYNISNVTDGYLDYRIESVSDRIDYFEDRIEDMEDRLNQKMETMINRFVRMELALGQLQNQSNWLAGQIGAISGWG